MVISAYNYGPFVLEAVASALDQSLPPGEVIVVDDGSTDNSFQILQENYGSHPKVKLIHQRNEGQLSAVVHGLEAASGDILFFLDADDKFAPNHIENVVQAFGKNRDIDFLFTAYQTFGDREGVVAMAPIDLNLGYSYNLALHARRYVGTVMSAHAMRRSLVLTLLPTLRQSAPRWRINADDCLVYGASLAGARKMYLAEPTLLYRLLGPNNYFLRTESPSERFHHGFRRDSFCQLLATNLGISSYVRSQLILEFRSIQHPTAESYKDYCRIVWSLPEPWLSRLKIRIRMAQYYRKHRAPWER